MKTLLLAAVITTALEDAMAALTEAFGSSDYVLGGAALVILAALAVLAILKKQFPFVEPAAKLILGVARMFKKAPAPAADPAKQPGLDNVVPLEKPEDKK